MMDLSLFSMPMKLSWLVSTCTNYSVYYRRNCLNNRCSNGSRARIQKIRQSCVLINCKSEELGAEERIKGGPTSRKLVIGSPVIVIEAPLFLKTAASVPCIRANFGLVKPGDAGRIMSRKPKDVWAIRLSIGTYLIDGKYFKPLELDDSSTGM